jgi:hypothetical protein
MTWVALGLGIWLLLMALIIAVVHVSQRDHWPPYERHDNTEEKHDGNEP